MIDNLKDCSKKTLQDLDPQVLFVTGGPGSGKGTQCDKLVKNYKFNHYSVGDLFRAEKAKQSPLWEELNGYMSKGELVPTELTIKIIGTAINFKEKGKKVLIDGFPRELEQGIVFEKMLAEFGMILQYECSEEEILSRLLNRMNKTPIAERRDDDNPETMKARVSMYFNTSKVATNFFHRFGKVREIDAMGSPQQVYERTKEALKPNLYCVIGATCMGKTVLAKKLALHTHYNYIDAKVFFKHNGVTSCQKKAKLLGEFVMTSPSINFVLDGFPETKQQAKIFFDTFTHPLAVFNVKAQKDEVYNRITNHSQGCSVYANNLKTEFKQYLQLKDALEGYLSTNPAYKILNGLHCQNTIFNQTLDFINPHLLVAATSENQELANSVLAKLEKEQGYINLDYEVFIAEEKKRGLTIQEDTEVTQQVFLSLFRKAIYGQAQQNRKYILSNVPRNFNLLDILYKKVCKFEKLLYFTPTVDENGEAPMSLDWAEIIGYYHFKKMLIKVNVDDTDIIDFHLKRRARYGLIVGPLGVGKTLIAKKLKQKNIVKRIRLEKYKESLMKRLSTDDEEVSEITNADAYKHLRKDLTETPIEQVTLLEEFPFVDGGFQALIDVLGEPTFILRLNATEETVTKRYMLKNDIQEELSEDDVEIIKGFYKLNEEINTIINEMVKKSQTLTIFEINVNQTEFVTLQSVYKIFRKRIFLTRTINPILEGDLLRNRVAFLCARHDYQFISLEDVYAQVDLKDPTQARDPHFIVNIILKMANSTKKFSRNILLYNYLNADGMTGTPKDFYPNSKDELFFIHHHIGEIRSCLDFVHKLQKLRVNIQIDPKPIKEEPVKGKKEGEEEDDFDELDDEEQKKKFNPDEFNWFNIEGKSKTFAQFFIRMKPTFKINIEYNDANFAKLNQTFREFHEELESGQDKCFYVQCTPFDPPKAMNEVNSIGKLDPNESEYDQKTRKIFDFIDTNKSGEISIYEMGDALHSTGNYMSLQTIERIITMYDTDHSGTMNFEEFKKFIKVAFQDAKEKQEEADRLAEIERLKKEAAKAKADAEAEGEGEEELE